MLCLPPRTNPPNVPSTTLTHATLALANSLSSGAHSTSPIPLAVPALAAAAGPWAWP